MVKLRLVVPPEPRSKNGRRFMMLLQKPWVQKYVHQIQAVLAVLFSLGTQLFTMNSLNDMAHWTWRRWVLGVLAVVVPYIAFAIRGGHDVTGASAQKAA